MTNFLDRFISDYSSEKSFEKKIDILLEFINYYYDSDFERVNILLEKELELFKNKNSNKDGQTLIRFMFAYSYFERGNFKRGEQEMKAVMEIFDNIKHPEIKAQILHFLAFFHSHQGNFDKAFEYCYASIKEGEKAISKKNVYWGPYTLGVLYFDLKDFENSEKFYNEALQGFIKYDNPYGVARSETGLSSVYIQYEKYMEAEKLLQRSLEYYTVIQVTSGQSRSLNDLGVISRKTGKPDKALEYYKQALKLRKETNHSQGVATSLNEISEVLLEMKEYGQAEQYLLEAKEACEKIHNRAKLYRNHYLFSQLYRNTNEPWKALEHFDLFEKLKSQVVGEAANNKIKELQTRMATEKAENEKEIERLKNVEIKKAYVIIEEKQKEILNSIEYALRIQTAILPPQRMVKQYLEKSFILYKPKDIVAGDFYWMEIVNDLVLFAACDCTGHGVPGAMVSVVCHNALNRAVREFGLTQPAAILDKTAELVIENFSNSEEKIKDGMDISLCAYNSKTKTIQWAGANNALWLLQNGELIVTKADKQPIGMNDDKKPFTNHTFTLNNGDTIYLFTDGFADQFGGDKKEKKLTRKRFKEQLLLIQNKSLQEQGIALDNFITEYRKSVEQIDDILVMGVKI